MTTPSSVLVAELRELTSTTVEDFNDDALGEILEALSGSVNAAAASIWRRKAAKLATLVDVTESGSSRSNSQAFKQAKEMAAFYQELADGETEIDVIANVGRVRIKTIERD